MPLTRRSLSSRYALASPCAPRSARLAPLDSLALRARLASRYALGSARLALAALSLRARLASLSELGSARSPRSALAPLALRARLAIRTRRALAAYALNPLDSDHAECEGV